MKQTAVEWLIQQLTTKERNVINKTFLHLNKTVASCILENLFAKAKEMEREQIENAVIHGFKDANCVNPDITFSAYYDITYGGKQWQINPKKDQAETKVKPASL